MAKDSLNVIDFSGGLNLLVDKRDIADNESVFVSDLISYDKGSLKLAGVFHSISNSLVEYGLFNESYNQFVFT